MSAFSSARSKFIVLLLVGVAVVYYWQYTMVDINREKQTKTLFSTNETSIHDLEMVVPTVYDVHKKPKKIRYVYLDTNIMATVNQLEFMKVFDRGAYDSLIVLLEHFYKFYYSVLLGKYSCSRYLPILADLKTEIMNTISSFYFNVPQFSDDVDGNIYEIIDKSQKQLQAVLYKCLKVVNHKCRDSGHKTVIDAKGPMPFDKFRWADMEHVLY